MSNHCVSEKRNANGKDRRCCQRRGIKYLVAVMCVWSMTAQGAELQTWLAHEFSGRAVGMHAWGRELPGDPQNCRLQVAPNGHVEASSFTISMGVDAVTREGEHRKGYAYVFSLGSFGLRAPDDAEADAHNWQRFKREGNTLILETMAASYGAEKIVHTDYSVVTMDFTTGPSSMRVKVIRTYDPFAVEYDDMVRRYGYPGDDLLDRDHIGQPTEIMNTTCTNFRLVP